LVLFAVQAFAAYDSATVKKAMRTHAALLGETSNAVEANDFFLAAEKLMENATLFKSLMVMSPKKGSEAEWNRILNGMLKAAFKGIGACGEENAEGVAAAISELKAVKKKVIRCSNKVISDHNPEGSENLRGFLFWGNIPGTQY